MNKVPVPIPRSQRRIEEIAREPKLPYKYWAYKWGISEGAASAFFRLHRAAIAARRAETLEFEEDSNK